MGKCANGYTFYGNRRWTFGDARNPYLRKQILQFFAVSLIGLLLNNAILLFLEPFFSAWAGHWGFLPAQPELDFHDEY